MSRPLFWMAIFRRMDAFGVHALIFKPFGHRAIAAVSGHEIARDAADGGDAHAGLLVDVAVGQSALEQFDHGPAVGHRLQFGGRAQVAEEAAAFLHAAQREDGGAERAFVLLFLAQGDRAVGFHDPRQCINALIH